MVWGGVREGVGGEHCGANKEEKLRLPRGYV